MSHGEIGGVIPISELRSFIARSKYFSYPYEEGALSVKELERFITFYEVKDYDGGTE